jgi:hypothetical protein
MIQKKNSQQRKKKNNPKRNQKMNNKIMKTLVVQKNQTITKVVKTKKDKPHSHRYQYKNKEKYCSVCNTPLQLNINWSGSGLIRHRYICDLCDRKNSKKYYYSHRQKRLNYASKYRKLNRDRINEYHRKYTKSNPEKVKKWRQATKKKKEIIESKSVTI